MCDNEISMEPAVAVPTVDSKLVFFCELPGHWHPVPSAHWLDMSVSDLNRDSAEYLAACLTLVKATCDKSALLLSDENDALHQLNFGFPSAFPSFGESDREREREMFRRYVSLLVTRASVRMPSLKPLVGGGGGHSHHDHGTNTERDNCVAENSMFFEKMGLFRCVISEAGQTAYVCSEHAQTKGIRYLN